MNGYQLNKFHWGTRWRSSYIYILLDLSCQRSRSQWEHNRISSFLEYLVIYVSPPWKPFLFCHILALPYSSFVYILLFFVWTDSFEPITKTNVGYIVSAVLINDVGQILMMQEAKYSCYGTWYLPAGRMERGENITVYIPLTVNPNYMYRLYLQIAVNKLGEIIIGW